MSLIDQFESFYSRASTIWSNNIALIEPQTDCKITYGELLETVDDICQALRLLGVEPNAGIGLWLSKSAQTVAAILSSIKSGLCYIPLDIEAPNQRIFNIISDSGISVLFTHEEKADALFKVFGQLILGSTSLLNGSLIAIQLRPKMPRSFEGLQYVLYTSGSTGIPKGVAIGPQAAHAFVDWSCSEFKIQSGDVLSSVAPFHFDLSVFDLLAGLSSGASIVLFDHQATKNPMYLAYSMETFKISVWYSTPTTLQMMLRFGKLGQYDWYNLRLVLFAGEIMPTDSLINIKGFWKKAVFYNLYGPTETNVCTYFRMPDDLAEWPKSIPIGKPCPYTHYKIRQIKTENALPPVENCGELLITGESVMSGYLGMPELTEKSITIDETGNRWYHTGDCVFLDNSGNLIFQGRIDRMVKRNGYRIELGEIENAIKYHPNISQSLAVSYLSQGQTKLGLAFIPLDTHKVPSTLDINEFLKQYVPSYMLIDQSLGIEKWPVTSSGKTDIKQLQEWFLTSENSIS